MACQTTSQMLGQKPPDSALKSQVAGEFFYRLQLAQKLAITPSVQLLKDPALNPTDDTVWVWGIQFRLTLKIRVKI